jgi:hypothetical protein
VLRIINCVTDKGNQVYTHPEKFFLVFRIKNAVNCDLPVVIPRCHVDTYPESGGNTSTGWCRADWHISNLNIVPVQELVVVGGKGNGRGEDAILYGQSQRSVGTCNNALPVFVLITKQSL